MQNGIAQEHARSRMHTDRRTVANDPIRSASPPAGPSRHHDGSNSWENNCNGRWHVHDIMYACTVPRSVSRRGSLVHSSHDDSRRNQSIWFNATFKGPNCLFRLASNERTCSISSCPCPLHVHSAVLKTKSEVPGILREERRRERERLAPRGHLAVRFRRACIADRAHHSRSRLALESSLLP